MPQRELEFLRALRRRAFERSGGERVYQLQQVADDEGHLNFIGQFAAFESVVIPDVDGLIAAGMEAQMTAVQDIYERR